MAWSLRVATEADLPTLVRHRDAMWVEMGRLAPGEADPTSKAYGEWLGARMERGTLTAFVAEEGGQVLASGGVWIQEVQPRPGHPCTQWGYILSVYTEPFARGRGLAKAIVQACIAKAKEAGCTRATLHASEAGRPLYEKFGFERTDEMWLDLRPPEERPVTKRPNLAKPATGPPPRGP
jgi:GNAT superfamily N-acetyltransferase